MTDLYAAQAAVHENTPPGWYVGQPGYEDRYGQRSIHAFGLSEPAVADKRSREWTAVGCSELHCLEVMARCLGVISAGRWPR